MRAGITALATALLFGCSGDKVELGETGGAGGLGGSGASSGSGGGGNTGGSGAATGQKSADLDLLFVVDNSISMGDKQTILGDSMNELLSRLVNPRCVDASGKAVAQPDSPTLACPSGSKREFRPVVSLHVGVLSSSLGAHGGETCSEASPNFKPDQNDHGQLLAPRRGIATHEDRGFASWGAGTGPGAAGSVSELITQTGAMIVAAGETGCGYEAPLESMYRFLVDPSPPERVERQGNFSVPVGTDAKVLEQRSQFLRPGSTLAVVLLTDENDCSILDEDQGWLMTIATPGLPRATAVCNTNPDDKCCTSCGAPPPAGCAPHAQDAECSKNGGTYTSPEDHVNLRCFDHKRRYGIDFLHPVERYVRGFSQTSVEDRNGKTVPNPLFAPVAGKSRDPSQVVLATVTGVPWQLLATPASIPGAEPLVLMTPDELVQSGTWDKLVPNGNTPPADPHMRASIAPRPGLPGPNAGLLADPFHGHEWDVAAAYGLQGPGDLQYACIFELPEARDCSVVPGGCDCSAALGVNGKSPLCQTSTGSYSAVQHYAKAYPGLRQLQVARGLADRGIVGSICPKTLTGSVRDPGFGYNPVFTPLFARLQGSLQ